MHQKSSHLSEALFNNLLGIAPGTLGKDILACGVEQLKEFYPDVRQIHREKIKEIRMFNEGFAV